MFSIAHLRRHNMLRNRSPSQICKLLAQEKYEANRLAQRLSKRLKKLEKPRSTDRELVETIILDGNWRGLGSSPYHSELADIYWQAAALILEQYDVKYVNELNTREG
jgi:hypothetical protein